MENHGDFQLFENNRIEKKIRMTIRIPDDKGNAEYRVLSYSHRHITDKEFEELTKIC